MQTIKLEVDDSKVDIVMNIIANLKDNIILHYEVVNENIETKSFIKLSQRSLEKIWDNEEDAIYDRFLEI